MLPHDVWDSYYDCPCERCDETISWRHEDHGSCSKCHTQLCEDCKYEAESSCDICKDDGNWNRSTVCLDCLKYCETCDVYLHEGQCEQKHARHCNEKGRARRDLETAKKNVEKMKSTVKSAEENLRLARQRLEESQSVKNKAQRRYSKYV